MGQTLQEAHHSISIAYVHTDNATDKSNIDFYVSFWHTACFT
jgi:hypothetical protein